MVIQLHPATNHQELLGSNINRHRKQTIQKDEAQEHKYFFKK
jgi:hypothetical protein